jgi:hypothetical protein
VSAGVVVWSGAGYAESLGDGRVRVVDTAGRPIARVTVVAEWRCVGLPFGRAHAAVTDSAGEARFGDVVRTWPCRLVTAPPDGLYLADVLYPAEFGLPLTDPVVTIGVHKLS